MQCFQKQRNGPWLRSTRGTELLVTREQRGSVEYHDFSRMAAVRVSKRRYCGKIAKIKQQEGSDLHVYGSANLVQTLVKHDLVDAFWLKIISGNAGRWKTIVCRGHDPGRIQGDGKHSHRERRHYRELRACRRSPNRKSINIRPGWLGLLILLVLRTSGCTQRSLKVGHPPGYVSSVPTFT